MVLKNSGLIFLAHMYVSQIHERLLTELRVENSNHVLQLLLSFDMGHTRLSIILFVIIYAPF